MSTSARSRRVLLWLHRWLGLTLGLIFVVVAFSGSLLLFQPTYFRLAHGHLIPEGLPSGPTVSVDAWIRNGNAAAPGLGAPIAVWRPHVSHNVSDAGMLIYAGLEPGGLGDMGLLGVLVAPADGEVLGTFDVDSSPAYAPLFLHRALWAGDTGRTISAVMAVGTLLFLTIGLYVWWPGHRRAGRKLSPRPLRRTLTTLLPLHNWVGVWTAALLLIITASGLYLARPDWVEPILALVPGEHEHDIDHRISCGQPPAAGFDAALASARDVVPDGGDWTALYPRDNTGRIWQVGFRTGDATDPEHGDTWALIDVRCGGAELHETAETRPPRETAELWLTYVHDGSLFGRGVEIAVAVLGLVPLLMYVTGMVVWWRRRGPRTRVSPSMPIDGEHST